MVDTRYEIFDYLQLSLWYIAFYYSVQWQGLIYGSIFYFSCLYIVHRVLNDVFGLEALGGGDAIFFLDDERSTMNIITAMRMEKFKA